MKRFGFIGFGAMARYVLKVLEGYNGAVPELIGILDTLDAVGGLRTELANRVPVVETLEQLLALRPDLVVECSVSTVVRSHAEDVLKSGTNLLVISLSAFAEPGLLDCVRAAAMTGGAQLILPAGAIGGIDAIAAARLGGLRYVRLTSTKPPKAWKGTPAEQVVDLDDPRTAATLFRGSAGEAAGSYPKNANVAAALAIADLGLDATEVQLVADSTAAGNTHRIEAEGAFGSLTVEMCGNALPNNPKTSMLAALSVARTLLGLEAPVVI